MERTSRRGRRPDVATPQRFRRPVAILAVLVATASPGIPASAAELLVATVKGADFVVPGSGTTILVEFATDQPVGGVGFSGLWSAVLADEEDGIAPWSLALEVEVTAPDGSVLVWEEIGGDRTIADFPLEDFASGFDGVSGNGTFVWSFDSIGPPWVAGLDGVEFHLTTTVPDVEQVFTGSTEGGPLWNRPYYIAGTSGLGPVSYHAMPFTVTASGGYEIVSVVPSGNNFTFLYRGGFDPEAPLANLLDYGLGNGFAPNGTPAGTSRIDALLLEGESYHLVVSQWSATATSQPFTNTVVGPGTFLADGGGAPADLDGDGSVGGADLAILLAAWGGCPPKGACPADLDGDGTVGGADLAVLLADWS